MRLGSGRHFAATGLVTGLTADAAAMKIGAGATKVTRGTSSPGETELLSIGGEHHMFTFGIGCEFGCRLARCGDLCFAIGWEMV
jgi:hypothetical protein